MDVRCERCRVQYVFGEDQVGPDGLTVRCSNCGHVFLVKKKALVVTVPVKPGELREAPVPTADLNRGAPAQGGSPRPGTEKVRPWSLRNRRGDLYPFKDLSTLQKWIVERKAGRDDEVSHLGGPWRRLGDMLELEPFFALVERAERGAAPASLRVDRGSAAPAAAQSRGQAAPATLIDFPAPPPVFPGPGNQPEPTQTDRFAVPPMEKGGDAQAQSTVILGSPPVAVGDEGPVLAGGMAPVEASEPAWTAQAGEQAPEQPTMAKAPARRGGRANFAPVVVALALALVAAGVYFTNPGWLGLPAPGVQPSKPDGDRAAAPPAPPAAAEAAPQPERPAGPREAPVPGTPAQPQEVPPAAGAAPGTAGPPSQPREGAAKPPASAEKSASPPATDPTPPSAATASSPSQPRAQPPSPAEPSATSAPASNAPSEPSSGSREGEKRAAAPDKAAGENAAAAAPERPAQTPPGTPSASDQLAAEPTKPELPKTEAPKVAPPAPKRTAAVQRPQPEKPPSLKRLLADARRLRARGKPEAALQTYGRAIELEPANADALAGRGLCYLELSQYGPAEASFQAALEADARHAEALMGLAETYRYEGRRTEAVTYYQRYVAAHPDGEDAAAAHNAIDALKE